MNAKNATLIRPVRESDIPALYALEQASFSTDRLSKRRMRHWVHADNRIFMVIQLDGMVAGYCLVLLHKGTRLARLYSIAIAESARGRGLGKRLLAAAEEEASYQGRLYMRLEVARNNIGAIRLYKSMKYVIFGKKEDYYEDHQDALRMQKRIRYLKNVHLRKQHPRTAVLLSR